MLRELRLQGVSKELDRTRQICSTGKSLEKVAIKVAEKFLSITIISNFAFLEKFPILTIYAYINDHLYMMLTLSTHYTSKG